MLDEFGDDSELDELLDPSRQFALVARAIAFIRTHARKQPTLEEIAAAVHLSPFYLQRLFSSWAGLSPKRFLQYLTKEHAKKVLTDSTDVFSVIAETGLSSTSRLHELMISTEALSPAEIRASGQGLVIDCGIGLSPFGPALAGWTARGLCHFTFCTGNEAEMLAELAALWPRASIKRNDEAARDLMATVFPSTPQRGRLHLLLRGTNFQIKVWEALIRSEPGKILSYGQLARQAATPKAQRAVGSALAANTIAYLIPCHRVIRESGEIGSYRWGSDRKMAMQAWEAGRNTTVINPLPVRSNRRLESR